MRIHGHDSAPLGERDRASGSAAAAPSSGAEQASKAESLIGAQAVVVSAGASEAVAVGSRDRATHLDRVAKVKSAVRDGSYSVDLEKLAHKFIDEELAGPRR